MKHNAAGIQSLLKVSIKFAFLENFPVMFDFPSTVAEQLQGHQTLKLWFQQKWTMSIISPFIPNVVDQLKFAAFADKPVPPGFSDFAQKLT